MTRFAAIKTDRSSAVREAPSPPDQEPNLGSQTQVGGRTPARVGKKAVSGYFSAGLSQSLHMLALEQGRSLQALLGEAYDDLFRKYGKHPFGER